jgi:hypothetical protein
MGVSSVGLKVGFSASGQELAAYFVKDHPQYDFSALKRILNFTICSPYCQEKTALRLAKL